MILQPVNLNPALCSVLTAQGLEPASGSLSPSVSAPPLLILSLSLSLSLSLPPSLPPKNEYMFKKKVSEPPAALQTGDHQSPVTPHHHPPTPAMQSVFSVVRDHIGSPSYSLLPAGVDVGGGCSFVSCSEK